MVRDSIKIFARLKREENSNLIRYQIENKKHHEELILYTNSSGDFINNKPINYKYRKVLNLIFHNNNLREHCRFHKIFDQTAQQSEIFEKIAKPVVDKVLSGYNGTIFAYGQTGSGKTYSMTGLLCNNQEKGIIPRSIQTVLEYVKTSSLEHTIHISYLEIYKEVGYDLLNPKQAKNIEELQRVVLLEDGKGEAHLRNLSILQVSSLEEAMKLLSIGDTNKTMAVTPMNDSSSRSHCVFTIYITSKLDEGKIKKSKLHLVDLAGSERIYKSRISGDTLKEAKHINLSLHYLEQVILALSESTRIHIPFRNSMLTYILKDSLNGNSVTLMLATLAVNEKSLDETLSTCKFSQRVALINTNARVNEICDQRAEITALKKEIEDLKHMLSMQKLIKIGESYTLTPEEKSQCKVSVKKYVENSKSQLEVTPTMNHIQYCFKLLKVLIGTHENQIKKLKIDKSPDGITNFKIRKHFKKFCIQRSIAKNHAIVVEQCEENLLQILDKLEREIDDKDSVEELINDLWYQKNIYRTFTLKLAKIEVDIAKIKGKLKFLSINKNHRPRKYKNLFTSPNLRKDIRVEHQACGDSIANSAIIVEDITSK